MIRRLAQVRLSRLQFGLVALASVIATAVVIVDATPGRTALQSAVIAELQHHGVVIHRLAATAEPGASRQASGTQSGPASSAGSSTPASDSSSGGSSSSSSSGSSTGGDTTATTTSGGSNTSTSSVSTPAKTYKVKHVFMIALSTTSYDAAFGHASVARYLNGTLVPKGTLLTGYRSLGHSELSDYLAMVSGQAPNADTGADCATYSEFLAGAKPDTAGQVPGNGCIYPDTALTIGDQVTASGKVWKAYIDGIGSSTCVHPNSGAADDAALPGAGSEYDTRHNPFIYFHSLLDLGDCASDDRALTQLSGDLSSASKTPSYAFVAPGLCDDSSQAYCPDGKPGGIAGEDAFLRRWVPAILHSPAYKQNGALIIVFTISKPPSTTGTVVSTGTTGPTGPGGPAAGSVEPVQAGALVLSPYTTAGRRVAAKYDPYSVLRSIEDLFGYTALAHAKRAMSFEAAALPQA